MLLLKDVDFSFSFIGSNTPMFHNAQGIKDEYVYYWQITPGENNQITVTGRIIKSGNLAGLATLVSVLLLCCFMYIRLSKEEKQTNSRGQNKNTYVSQGC